MLRDKLVWGIEDARIQQTTGEDNLTFKKALDLAQALEVAAQDSKELSASTSAVVHKDLHQCQATEFKDGRLHPNPHHHVIDVKVNIGLLDAASNQKSVELAAKSDT